MYFIHIWIVSDVLFLNIWIVSDVLYLHIHYRMYFTYILSQVYFLYIVPDVLYLFVDIFGYNLFIHNSVLYRDHQLLIRMRQKFPAVFDKIFILYEFIESFLYEILIIIYFILFISLLLMNYKLINHELFYINSKDYVSGINLFPGFLWSKAVF